MDRLTTLFLVFLAVVILGCLFFGCGRYGGFYENLENMKLDMAGVDCATYDQPTCGTYPQCQWNGDMGVGGQCTANVLTETNVPAPETFRGRR